MALRQLLALQRHLDVDNFGVMGVRREAVTRRDGMAAVFDAKGLAVHELDGCDTSLEVLGGTARPGQSPYGSRRSPVLDDRPRSALAFATQDLDG